MMISIINNSWGLTAELAFSYMWGVYTVATEDNENLHIAPFSVMMHLHSIFLNFFLFSNFYFFIHLKEGTRKLERKRNLQSMPGLIRMKFNVKCTIGVHSWKLISRICVKLLLGERISSRVKCDKVASFAVKHFVKINKFFLHLICICLYHEGANSRKSRHVCS